MAGRSARAGRVLRWLSALPLPVALLLLVGLAGCEMQVEPGKYHCDPKAGGVCPSGWSCLPFGADYECQPVDEHVCGDGVLQAGEQCDGADNIPGSCEQYRLNPGNLQCTSLCTALCTACGNGTVETGPFGEGEQCDDGNVAARDGCSPECKQERPTWIQQTPGTSPPARTGHAMVYDADSELAVLFGGIAGATLLNDTWVYDGFTWTLVQTVNGPSPRVGHAMAYDSARGVVVLFGGSEETPAAVGLSDTWEFDGVDWTEVLTAHVPSNRYGAVAAYNPQSRLTVVFGGIHYGLHQVGTWEFDGEDWQVKIPQTTPADRNHASLVWAPAWQGLVLFGGSRTLAVSVSFDDTWLYRSGSWQDISTAIAPAARQGHAAFYDPHRERLVVFGGSQQPSGELLADPWEFDGEQWTPMTTVSAPSARTSTAVFWPEQAVAVLFGGQTSDASAPEVGDTWWLQYQAGDSVCGDAIRGADEICDGTQIAPEYSLSCEVLGFSGGVLGCSNDCRLDLSDCYH